MDILFIYCFHSYLTQYADSDNINYTLYFQFFKGIAMAPFKWADSSYLEKKQNWWPRTQTVITQERATPRRWSKEQKVVSQTMRWFSINNDMLIRYGWWARSRMHLLIKISFQFVFWDMKKTKNRRFSTLEKLRCAKQHNTWTSISTVSRHTMNWISGKWYLA